MLDNEPTGVLGDEPDAPKNDEGSNTEGAAKKAPRRRAASRPAGPPAPAADEAGETQVTAAVSGDGEAVAETPKRARKTAAKKVTAPKAESASSADDLAKAAGATAAEPSEEPRKAAPRTRTRKKAVAAPVGSDVESGPAAGDETATAAQSAATTAPAVQAATAAKAAEATSEAEPSPGEGAATEAAAEKPKTRTRRRAASAPAGPPRHHDDSATAESAAAGVPTTEPTSAVAATSAAAKSAAAEAATPAAEPAAAEAATRATEQPDTTGEPRATRSGRRRATASQTQTGEFTEPQESPERGSEQAGQTAPSRRRAKPAWTPFEVATDEPAGEEISAAEAARAVIAARAAAAPAVAPAFGSLLFQAPDLTQAQQAAAAKQKQQAQAQAAKASAAEPEAETETAEEEHETTPARRSRSRNRNRNRDQQEAEPTSGPAAGADQEDSGRAAQSQTEDHDDEDEDDEQEGSSSSRRRRRRRRRTGGETVEVSPDDPPNTVVKVREARDTRTRTRDRGDRKAPFGLDDDVQGVRGSTRLEAKKQRRREGRDTGRRRAPLITEAEFLARRESVERVMVVRQTGDRTQIGVLEDGVLVEHYVNRATSSSYVGNVYLGKVQNVLPSMEAAFVDIGKGRNAVLYAGEVNFDAAGITGQAKRIESVLKSGQAVLTQVTKDPIGHKGARLTSQVSLPGRYLVYVPEGSMTGISRKLPENERTRLKSILKQVVPEDAGVIVRTAAEGASEDELRRDVERLAAQWSDIQRKAQSSGSSAPTLLYGEPDLTVRVVRDIFNEDFSKLIVSGGEAWDTIREYVHGVAPDLAPRLERWTSEQDVFSVHRIDEQLAKALDRKVWLPSGGSLVIDRTEAMVVIDVNTGKFTGSGGNLEETVTRNNIEAAEEIVRQLRLRDLGGIVVIDFIDMVLESNRDLVMRRLLECLGRDRTKHQVAEVTSLGLVQMTRKRVGQGLLEAFSETCDKCNGRGVLVHMEPVQLGKGEHLHEHEDRSHKQQQKAKGAAAAQQPSKDSAGAGDGGVVTAEAETTESARSNRRKRRKSHGHMERQNQFDVDGVPEEYRDFVDEDQPAGTGAVTVTRVMEADGKADADSVGPQHERAAASITAEPATAVAVHTAPPTRPAPEVAEEQATFPAEPSGPAVAASAESEAAVEAALGGSGSLDVGGDTAVPKKRGLRVRRAAKRPAGPPAPSGDA